jgi:hypothetical protein
MTKALATLVCSATFGAMALAGAPQRPEATPSVEYQVKAGFLFNFAKFVQWPAGVFSAPDSPIVVGILGDDPFGPFLDQVAQAEPVGQRKVVIKRITRPEDASQCHILFVPRSVSGPSAVILAGLRAKSVLTVGETDRFLEQGGIINLVIDKGKVRFEINLDAAKEARLTVSSKLLKLAQKVQREGAQGQ